MPRTHLRRAICLLAALVLAAVGAAAWDGTGHRVVARIAWDELSPELRLKAVELLMEAPEDADLASLLPRDRRALAVRQRALFTRAATWPDIVRDGDHPERRRRYSRTSWHFINLFWDDGGERRDLSPDPTNVVERLDALSRRLADPGRAAAERAIDLAWLLHLVGDLHQPLHASARVTAREPEGDRGGNLFSLGPDDNLHRWWDRVLSREYRPRLWHWTEEAHIDRLARTLRRRHPRARLEHDPELVDFDAWAREGLALARCCLYPERLARGQPPPSRYRRTTRELAEARIVLAGYRLAAVLDRALPR